LTDRLPAITVQICTFNRRALLARVLRALFDQDISPDDYEIVLVDDGSTDGTYEEVIRGLQPPCALHVVRQSNAGLAHGRNVGLARARGRVVTFMDDDVLATPGLLRAHIRFHERHQRAICRGAVINVASFDSLPPARWSPRNYSGAYFWTTNVSAPRDLIVAAGGFDERFREYGWEDLELGYRLRRKGVPSILATDALVYHYKPAPRGEQLAGMTRQARAQARTAVLFLRKHPHWRIALATGQVMPLLWWSTIARRVGWPKLLERIAAGSKDARDATPSPVAQWAAARLARAAYFEELSKSRGA
jgi:GT2 family glycosyltransferase